MRERAPSAVSTEPDSEAPSARTRRMVRYAGGVLLLMLAAWTLRSYLVSLGWAVIIAISVWPLYRPFRARLGNSQVIAPLLVTFALAMLLMLPITLALTEIGHEGQVVMEWLTGLQQNGMPPPEWLNRLPLLGQQLHAWWQEHLAHPQSAEGSFGGLDSQTISTWTRALGGALISRLLHAFLTFLTLFILLRNGDWISNRVLATIDRWFGGPGERLAEKMASAVRGTVNGTILVALGEGILIGLGFVIARVPHALLFTILTIAFAMLPLGAWLAFGVAAVVFALDGGTIGEAIAVFGWGAVVMLIGDNFVQPSLIGGAVRLPFLWTLLGILGGLETFGLIGLFLGPVLMAALLTIWHHESEAAPQG